MSTITRLLWVCLPALLASCGRESQAPPPTAPPVTAPASPRGPHAKSEVSGGAPTTIPDSGDSNAILQQLTQALRDYVVRTRSVPKDFDEFALKSTVSFPAAPPGKKYAIQGQQVVLVKR